MQVRYFEWNDSILQNLQNQLGLMRLFNYLVTQQDGDVDEALAILRELQSRGHIDPNMDLDEFERQLREDSIVREHDGQLSLTPRGE